MHATFLKTNSGFTLAEKYGKNNILKMSQIAQ